MISTISVLSNKNCSEQHYPRLAQTLIDYDTPFKKLPDDFTPYNKVRMASRK